MKLNFTKVDDIHNTFVILMKLYNSLTNMELYQNCLYIHFVINQIILRLEEDSRHLMRMSIKNANVKCPLVVTDLIFPKNHHK